MRKALPLLTLLTLSLLFAAIPDGYYDPANGLSGDALKLALHNIIDGHTEYSYDFLWTGLKYTDEDPNNSSNFILLYSGRSEPKTAAYPVWNREHSWPKSHGDFGTSAPAGTDMHHLRPTDVDVNGARGSKDYDNGGSLVSETTDCYTDADSFEPRDEVKGDCARMMFYMVTRYEGDASGEPDLELVDYTGTSGPILGKLSTLLAWHVQDPVDDWERRRNDRVYSYQNNRNPFIDHPEYVSYIWGGETPNTLDAPVATAASDVDSTSFTANWNAVDSADAYKLYVSGDASFNSYLNGYDPKTIAGLYENITGLTPETNYYYKLKAYNGSEESGFSNTITVLTLEGGGSVNPPDTGDAHIETFANFPETGSSYNNGTFTGQDGSTWSYDQCRGDIIIENETPCLGKGRTPEAAIWSGTISGGIVTLSFQYKQAYSTDVSLDVYVNDVKYATVTTSSETGVTKESGDISVNISEDAVIKFVQSSDGSGQVAIDNVTWTSFPVAIDPIDQPKFQLGDIYPNPFNPVCTLPFSLDNGEQVRITLLDVLGNERKQISNGYMDAGNYKVRIQAEDLPSGIYFVRFQSPGHNLMKKVLLIK
jgi:endonuclease I